MYLVRINMKTTLLEFLVSNSKAYKNAIWKHGNFLCRFMLKIYSWQCHKKILDFGNAEMTVLPTRKWNIDGDFILDDPPHSATRVWVRLAAWRLSLHGKKEKYLKRGEKGWYVAAAASSMSLESRKSQPWFLIHLKQAGSTWPAGRTLIDGIYGRGCKLKLPVVSWFDVGLADDLLANGGGACVYHIGPTRSIV